MNTYDDVQIDNGVKTTTSYTCESENLKYTIIGENIKENFDFLIDDIPNLLKEVESELSSAKDCTDAFYFENGSSVGDISHAYKEIAKDIENITGGLSTLHSALIKDIDNVNAELSNNFGYWVFNKPKKAGISYENVEE